MSPRQRTLVRGSLALLGAAGLAAALAVLLTVPPTADTLYPKCMLHQTTGLHCPGCGMTRSVHAALNGQFEQAFAYNVLAVVVLPYLAFLAVRSSWHWVWGTPAKPSRWPLGVRRWAPLAIGIVLLVFGVLRNVPVYPLTLLAPHELNP